MFSVSVASVAVPDAYASSGIGIERYSLLVSPRETVPVLSLGGWPPPSIP